MELKLESLKMIHFKGIKELEIIFSDITNIYGENETGKTSVMDAFTWLLFGKNAEDQKEFNIKTLRPDGEHEHKLEHEVSGVLLKDEIKYELRRVFRENWKTRKGDEVAKFSGHETLFFINKVPMQAGEYKEQISSIIPEEMFKLLTNPLAFNSLKWEVRRNTLFALVTEKSDSEIASGKPEFEKLMESISNKTLHGYKAQIIGEIKLLKENKAQIPARVDEANRNMPQQPDYEAVQAEIDRLNAELSAIENKLQDAAKAYETSNSDNQAKQNKVYELKKQISQIKNLFYIERDNQKMQAETDKRKFDNKINNLKESIADFTQKIKIKEQAKQDVESYLNELRVKWDAINKETEPEVNVNEKCPTCGAPFNKSKVLADKEAILDNWKKDKLERLNKINKTGTEQKESLEKVTYLLTSLLAEKANLEKQLEETYINYMQDPPEAKEMEMPVEKVQQIEKLEAEANNLLKEIKPLERPSNLELTTQRSGINQELDNLKAKLSIKDTIEKTKKRIQDLIASEKDLAQQIASLEKTQFTIESFEKAKVDAVQEDINKLFVNVKFKMFNQLINGGFEPCCDTLYPNETTKALVPWNDLNTAGMICAGIDVINTLSKYYGIFAPIFIDNRESVTRIPATKSQVINLIKDENYKTLTVK